MAEGFDPDKMALVSRISVMEYMMSQMFRMLYEQRNLSMDDIKKEHQKVRSLFMKQTFPEFGAAGSDFVAAEMSESMDSILSMIEDVFARYNMTS
jgi:hypothetical protein